jgi:ubiquinone/menaquinone biosynthesis C-methylase UbiE
VIAFSSAQHGDRVIDVGCGTGDLTGRAARSARAGTVAATSS